MSTDSTQRSYDTVAAEYTRRMLDELDHKPLDRELLDRFAAQVKDRGRVCDLGCGPGHVTRYLSERGVDVVGVDLSPAMIEQARAAHPGVAFQQGDMRALPFPADSLAGITAFYSIIHIPRAEVTNVLKNVSLVLRSNAVMLVSFHIGDEVRHLDEWWDQPVSVDFTFFQPGEMTGYLEQAGFHVDDVIERDPYPDVEVQTRRAYVFARKPAT